MGVLSGKVALITGAGSGIGEETVKLFAAEGARVAVATQTQAQADRVVGEIRATGGDAFGVSGDIADPVVVKSIVDQTLGHFGRIDILHNNAAMTDAETMMRDQDVVSMDIDLWDRAMAVNLRAPMLFCKYVVPHMIQQGGGSVINTGAAKAVQGDLAQTAYGATKAALVNLTKNVATQYGKQGVRANIMIVGLVLSGALRENFPPEFRQMMESHHLTPYIGEPRHVAQAALFLASDASAFVTGHELFVDGGIMAHISSYADFMRAAPQG